MNREDVDDLLRMTWQFSGVIFVCSWFCWSALSDNGVGLYHIEDFIKFIGNIILK